MVTRVNSSLPAVVNQSRSYVTPIIAVLAIAALALLVIRVASSLINRVQAMSDPHALHTQGKADAKNKKYDSAIRKYTLALQLNPEDELRREILCDRAKAHRQIYNPEDALTDYRAVLTCTAETDFLAMVHMCMAEVLAEKNEHGLAVQEYTEALELTDPDSSMKPTLLFKRAYSQVVLGADVKAIENFSAALACDIKDNNLKARILAYRAATYHKMNQIEEARQGFTEAVICDCDDMELRRFIYIESGRVYSSMGEHDLARADYEAALRSGEGEYDEHVFAEIVWRRGSSFFSLGRLDDAIVDFTEANECTFDDPNLRASILHARAMVYIHLQRIDDALKDLTDAIDCEPTQDLDQYLHLRALVLKNLGRYIDAIADFTKAMEFHLLPQEPRADILHQRGIAHRENNNLEQARRDWDTALKCEISQKLREAINAELTPKGASTVSRAGAILGWVKSKWTSSSNK